MLRIKWIIFTKDEVLIVCGGLGGGHLLLVRLGIFVEDKVKNICGVYSGDGKCVINFEE